MQVETKSIEPELLLLDPNNYRFLDLEQYRRVANLARFAEDGVQDRALALLQTTKSFELDALKDSILTNGFVPLEQIVVEPYPTEGKPTHYLVVEGNRRVAAVKSILKEQRGGASDIEPEKLATLTQLPAIVIRGTSAERASYRQTLMAIRHVAGIREWGPYQQAKLIAELYEKGGNFTKVAKEIGISAREVGRRYRAYKALEQMEDDDDWGEYAHPKLYALFHEAMSVPTVRDEWLKFKDSDYRTHDETATKAFYELLSERRIDDITHDPKLKSARDVRALRDIVERPLALRILLDPERRLQDAIDAASSEALASEESTLEVSLMQALSALRQPAVEQYGNPTRRAVEIWNELLAFTKVVEKFLPPLSSFPAVELPAVKESAPNREGRVEKQEAAIAPSSSRK